MSEVVLLVPAGIDDPAHPSGGNRYDRCLAAELPGAGWDVRTVPVPTGDQDALAGALAACSAGAVVLADGLVLASAPGDAAGRATDVRLVPLLHMAPPPDPAGEWRALLSASRAVVATSGWTRRQVLEALPPGDAPPITVAPPGVELVLPVAPSATGARLRCVAALLPHKGQDVLLAALATLRDLDWRCDLVGATDLDPGYTHRLRNEAAAAGITDRIRFLGAGDGLRELYDGADLLVVPSRAESYGMVITEAIACGLPVIATDTGGVRQALGSVDGRLPGVLVPPGSAAALADALAAWLSRPRLRAALTSTTLLRRRELPGWATTARTVAAALADVLDEPEEPRLRRSG